ncbi:MAG TPA: hypothetical protein PLW32_02160 [Chitinophagaceae bacterium]|nr:hypothetical protein [Chitinophagaceae bacterium]
MLTNTIATIIVLGVTHFKGYNNIQHKEEVIEHLRHLFLKEFLKNESTFLLNSSACSIRVACPELGSIHKLALGLHIYSMSVRIITGNFIISILNFALTKSGTLNCKKYKKKK